MAIQTEVWATSIEDVLFQNQEFISNSVDHSAFVKDSIVHLPQAGAAPAVAVNRAVFPATITERTDTLKDYSLRSLSTDPIRLRDLDEIQTSYDKRTSILASHTEVLNETIGNYVANDWGVDTAARVVKTSGAAGSDALAPSATGTRNAADKADFRNLAKIFDNDNVATGNRYVLMPVGMYYQLFADTTLLSRDYMERSSQEMGVINELYGFKIMIRPTVNVFDATFAKKAIGAAAVATDNLACIAWSSNYVSSALGDIKVYANENVAEHYGSIFSAEVEHAGAVLRSDEKGVATLVQQ